MTAPFAKRLKIARVRADLKQYQLGLLAGLNEDQASAKINQYEQGTHVPRFPRLKQLAKALKVPAAYFYAESEDLAELLYHYERLTQAEKQRLLALAKN